MFLEAVVLAINPRYPSHRDGHQSWFSLAPTRLERCHRFPLLSRQRLKPLTRALPRVLSQPAPSCCFLSGDWVLSPWPVWQCSFCPRTFVWPVPFYLERPFLPPHVAKPSALDLTQRVLGGARDHPAKPGQEPCLVLSRCGGRPLLFTCSYYSNVTRVCGCLTLLRGSATRTGHTHVPIQYSNSSAGHSSSGGMFVE